MNHNKMLNDIIFSNLKLNRQRVKFLLAMNKKIILDQQMTEQEKNQLQELLAEAKKCPICKRKGWIKIGDILFLNHFCINGKGVTE